LHTESAPLTRFEPMAIVGVGCKFPGGIKDLESFWELISHGVDAVSVIPMDRWDWKQYLP
jgi:acyl transferase domain-containing protein